MFEGFRRMTLGTGDVDIHCVVGGVGPPLLLLHGYPQNLAMWAKAAPLLAERFTVVCADLRGYGDSDKPRGLPDHTNYAFRTMAADQVRLMQRLGFERFHVAGHDRGGRVAHRMTLDWPQVVMSMTILDVIPTYLMYTSADWQFASTFWLWFFLPLPEPFPERLIGADPDFFFSSCLGRYGGTELENFDFDLLQDYRRCWRNPEMIHASCSDYRAGATVDMDHDRADLGRMIECPSLVLWAADGLMVRQFDFARVWGQRCTRLRIGSVAGGHFFPEQRAVETAAALSDFLGP